MKQLLLTVSILALTASAAMADPKDSVTINDPTVDTDVAKGDIDIDIYPRDIKIGVRKTFFNVLDTVQHGRYNKAAVIQLDSPGVRREKRYDKWGKPYYVRVLVPSFNGSWTFQRGNYNSDWGVQLATDGGANVRFVRQVGNSNSAATFQQTRRGLNLLSIDQSNNGGYYNGNSAAVIQKNGLNVLGITQSGYLNTAAMIQANSRNFATVKQSGYGNKAVGFQGRYNPRKHRINITTPYINVRTWTPPVNVYKTVNINKH